MSFIPPISDEDLLFKDSIHPKTQSSGQDKFSCYAPDLAKSVPWYEALFGFRATNIGKKPTDDFGFYKVRKSSREPVPTKGEWIFGLDDHPSLSPSHIECGVHSLFDMHAAIARMRNIGVEMSDEPLVNEIIEDYPKGWMRYKEDPGMAHYLGRRPHHSTACGFIDPAGTPVIIRLEVEEAHPGFWR